MAIINTSGANEDAYNAMLSALKEFGVDTLGPTLWGYLEQGFSEDLIWLKIQDTDVWRTRFAGNEARRKAGLPILSPAEYLSTEAGYQQVLRSFGLPKGFYDQPADFADFIGKNVSVGELQDRLDLRRRIVGESFSGVASYAAEHFGGMITDSFMYFTDPQRALPLLEKQVAAAEIGSVARSAAGLDLTTTTALRLAEENVSEAQARAGFATIGMQSALRTQLPGQSTETLSAEDQIRAELEGNAEARKKVERVAGTRVMDFGGGGGFATTKEGVTGLRTAGG